MSTVLVTGGTGFIGRHLVRALAAAGDDVHVVTRESSLRRPETPAQGVTLHALPRPSVDVAAVIDSVAPTTVFHLATHFVARHRPDELADMVDSNVTLGTVVAEGAVRVDARLVHTTSAWQHFDGAEYDPVSLYAAMKQALVDVVRYFQAVESLDAREVCLFDTYGPDDDRGKLVGALLGHARQGTALTMSSGRQLVDLTHVSDVVAALRAADTYDGPVTRLVARSGSPVTVRELVDVVQDVTGRTLDVTWGAREDRPREMTQDWSVASDDIGWRPRVALRDGLGELWAAAS
jgi:nucleoside-diphosphate-sugar epimerase